MAIQVIIDLYECDNILNDINFIKNAAHEAINYVEATIVEECIHKFEPIGITYFAVISKSHFSIHTWPEYKYAAIDIFSCSDEVVEGITEKLQILFGAKEIKSKCITRNLLMKENT